MGIIPTQSSSLPSQHQILSRKWFGRAVIGITFVCLTSTLSLRFYAEPQLGVGTFVDQDLRSPRTITATDIEATKQAKELAKQQVTPIYRNEPDKDAIAFKHLEDLLKVGDKLRISSGQLPYVDRKILSDDVQRFIRQTSAWEWEQVQARAQRIASSSASTTIATLPNREREISALAATELAQYRIAASPQDFQMLIATVTEVRTAYAVTKESAQTGPEMFRDRLLEMTNEEWEASKITFRQALADLQSSGVVSGLPEEMLHHRIIHLSSLSSNFEQRPMAIALLKATAKPNISIDQVATADRILKTLESVPPQTVYLKAGEIIVKGGEKITERQFVILDELKLTQRKVNFKGLLMMASSTAIAFAIFGYANRRWQYLLKVKLHVKDWLCIGIVCIGGAIATSLMAPNMLMFLPLASMGLILGSFYSSRLAMVVSALMAILLGIAVNSNLIALSPVLVGAMLAATITNRPLTRSHLAATGLLVGLVQGAVYLAIAIFLGSTPPILMLVTALQYASGGMIAAIIALGAIPYLEHISYALTPFRLAELANLDRPLLRRLVTETPGTFQHTLFVANLAEAAAREIGADTALVRTGTLYHDIGKTLRPEYFIENQMGQTNPHDVLNDPWLSAQIVKEHVTGGLKLAQKHRLPEMLQAFIPEHQGTIAIMYFYCQAQKRSDHVIESEFRYIGPIPQSRETGLVMLADACEAALRSLGTDTTFEEGKNLLIRIFEARWNDGQLKDCSLTWEDLERIAPVFLKVWQERNHGRIKYPHLADKLDPSGSALPDHLCNSKLAKSADSAKVSAISR